MNPTLYNALAKAKPRLLPLAQATLGRLPPLTSRLTGALAKDGGKAVRDVRLRPWASVNDGNFLRWQVEARALFRRIYLGGDEGLPQLMAERFAERWAAYCGCRYGLLLMHGTDALRIGLASVLDHDGLEYGGEVIVPNFSFIASATAALDRRFGVVFVDVDPSTLLIDPIRVEEAIVSGKTRAILPVHLFGQPADMTSLRTIADKHGLKIIEDAAQAHGAKWESGPVGSLGNAGAFSFQSSKNLACGEGGALVTNDEQIFERAYSMHNVGRSRTAGSRWRHVTLGWNCRPTEYQAALLAHRLGGFDRLQGIRAANFKRLRQLMGDIDCLEPLAVHRAVRAHGMYMFAMRYKPERCGGLSIDAFLEYVQAEGGPVHRAFETTISDQPVIRDLIKKRPQYFRSLPTPISDQAVRDTVYVPHDVFLGTRADMEDIVAAVKKVERHFVARGVSRPLLSGSL
jgi:dTDP-4-amino-4,6-dideoxygalactose transaminase